MVNDEGEEGVPVKKFIMFVLALSLRFAFWFRYRITIKGLDKLDKKNLTKPGGVLFLPNHPCVFVDPTVVTIALFPKFLIRPMIVEYFYYTPVVNSVARLLGALPVPDFDTAMNTIKKRKIENVLEDLMDGLKKGENFLLYPAGRTKNTRYETIGGASATQKIISETPEANVVLVRTKGLWGSSFSRAATGSPPDLFQTVWRGFKKTLKNLIFFNPRREIIVEFVPAPEDFPYSASRLDMNRWLENWYNQPDGLSTAEPDLPGDSLMLVSYSIWGKDLLEIHEREEVNDDGLDLSVIPNEIKAKIIQHLSEISSIEPQHIKTNMSLTSDLGLDSLDIAEVMSFLHQEFGLEGIPGPELTTVGRVMCIAAKQITVEQVEEEAFADLKGWNNPVPHENIVYPDGETIPEVFLEQCHKMGNAYCCGDERIGVMTYSQLKLRAILLANLIREMPGDYIGILLPATVGANLLVLSVQLAGKIPLMINWTIGPKHIDNVLHISNVQCILTSWAFIDRLKNVDLSGLEDKLVMLEDVRHKLTLVQKLKAFFISKLPTKNILKKFNLGKKTKDDTAVLLFTSGSESMPKGVPLTHENLMSNHKSMLECVNLYKNDVLVSILPPFHSFGFSVTGLLPVLAGLRVVFSPDPTDGKKVKEVVCRWKGTILCGAPTFLKGVLRAGHNHDLQSLRIVVTAAEKAPAELLHLVTVAAPNSILLEGYGITECGPFLTAQRENEPHTGVGKPPPSIEICVVDNETNEPLPPNTQGMILAAGKNIFKGYINPDIASPFVEVEGREWYRTGDLGYLDDNRNLIITGRLKRFVKIGGEMISLTEVENSLSKAALENGWISGAEGPSLAVVSVEEAGEKTRLYLFANFDTTVEAMNEALRKSGFGNIVRVFDVFKVDEIPIMGTGKIHFRLLETEFLPRFLS